MNKFQHRVTAEVRTRIDKHGDRQLTTNAREWLNARFKGRWACHYYGEPATFLFEKEADANRFKAEWSLR